MQQMWLRSLGWEDPLEKGKATHSSILSWRIPMDKGAWQATVHWVSKSQTRLTDCELAYMRTLADATAHDHFQGSV